MKKFQKVFSHIKDFFAKKRDAITIIIAGIAISLFAMGPYLNSIVPYGHDMGYHLNRINEIANGLNIRKFPVLIHAGLLENLGYANGIFYPQLFMYIPAIFVSKFGLLVIPAYKVLLIIITFITFISMYYSAKGITKNKYIAWVSTLLYVFSLYRLSNIYVRGAIGELLAYSFSPLILYGLYNVIYEDGKKWWIFVLGTTCLIYSHLLSVLIMGIFFILLCLINADKIFKNKKEFLNLLKSVVVIILLSMAYFAPMFEQKCDDVFNVDGRSIENCDKVYESAMSLKMAFYSRVKGGYATDSGIDENTMSEGIGIVLIIMAVLNFLRKDLFSKENRFNLQLLILGIIIWIATTKVCVLWKYISLLNVIQFPFRLNNIVSLCFAVTGATAFCNILDKDRIKDYIILFTIFYLTFMGSILDNVALDYTGWNGGYEVQTSTFDRQVGNAEYLPDGTYIYDLDLYNINDKDNKLEFTQTGSTITFEYNDLEHDMQINMPLVYYKGYKASIVDEDGNKRDLKTEKNITNAHVLVSSNEKLKGIVTVEYRLTIIQKISYVISILSTIIFVLYLFIISYKEKIIKIFFRFRGKNESKNK